MVRMYINQELQIFIALYVAMRTAAETTIVSPLTTAPISTTTELSSHSEHVPTGELYIHYNNEYILANLLSTRFANCNL